MLKTRKKWNTNPPTGDKNLEKVVDISHERSIKSTLFCGKTGEIVEFPKKIYLSMKYLP
jgi:hypothetical protein